MLPGVSSSACDYLIAQLDVSLIHCTWKAGQGWLCQCDFSHVLLVYRKQRSGSELEYTEKLQQYSKFMCWAWKPSPLCYFCSCPLIQSIIQSPVWGRKTLPCCLGGGPSTQIIWVEVDTCAAGNNSTLDEEGLPTHWNVKYLLMQHFSEVFAWWNFSLRKVICLVSIFSPWNTHGMNCKLPNVIQVLHFSVCLWTGCCHLKAKNKAKWIVC